LGPSGEHELPRERHAYCDQKASTRPGHSKTEQASQPARRLSQRTEQERNCFRHEGESTED